MSAPRYVLWSRQRGTTHEPQVRKRGTLSQCRIELRFLAEAADRNHGVMPYPWLDMVIIPADANAAAAFRTYIDSQIP